MSAGRADPLAALEGPLRAADRAARREHPRVDLAFEAFAEGFEAAARRRCAREGLPIDAAGFREVLAATLTADLWLAIACERGVDGAWDRFREAVLPRLRGFIARRAGAHAAGEVLEEVMDDLALPVASWRPGLGGYDGAGSLFGFCATIVHRRLAAAAAGRERRATSALDAAPEPAAPPAHDPAVLAAASELEEGFRAAVRATWRALTPKETLALVWRFGHGLAQREIARALGVGEPRVTRLVQAGAAKLREALLRIVPGAEGDVMARPELWSSACRALADSLATPGAAPPPTVEARNDAC